MFDVDHSAPAQVDARLSALLITIACYFLLRAHLGGVDMTWRPRYNDPPATLRHNSHGIHVPPIAAINDHTAMYKSRAKLRDILHVVDRHNT